VFNDSKFITKKGESKWINALGNSALAGNRIVQHWCRGFYGITQKSLSRRRIIVGFAKKKRNCKGYLTKNCGEKGSKKWDFRL